MILRVCVVIPTYNNSRAISKVVKDVLTTTPFPVLVIDDGSDTVVANSLYSWEVRQALEEGRLRLHRFEKNRGKGAALRFAIQDLATHGFTHMVTIDGDGQHFAREIAKLVDVARKHPWDLVIGNRMLKSETVPGVSKFGRKFSNFWVGYETGMQIKDSQSGFRLYPLLPLQTMRFLCNRYDFEIEVLIRLMWKGIAVREVEIEVHYPEKGERVTHFNKFWDNARISLLNAALVSLSLLRTHRSPPEVAIGLGIGVFLGCTPFFGFHTLLAAGVSVLFRLNFVVLWIGTHVSTPLLAPLLIMSEIYIGRTWLHAGESGGAKLQFFEWIEGSAILGVGLGVATTLVTLAVFWYLKNRKARTNWSGRTRGGRLGNGFLKIVLRHAGLRAGYCCLLFIVPYFYFFAPKGRRGLNEYWRLVEPGDRWLHRQWRIMKHFFRYGQVLMDRIFQGYHSTKQFSTQANGMENILQAMREKHGLIMLSAHLGGWDLAAALLSTNGFTDEIHVVEFRSEGLSFQKIKENIDPTHVHSLNSRVNGDAIFEIHSALKNGGCLGLMGDRPLGDRFELLPFLGRLAPFDMTAFRLAAATRVPLLVTFGFKSGDGYNFFARAPKVYAFNDQEPRETQCYNWACEYAREVERMVRQYPDQWFNFYPFWSALPAAPSGELGAQGNNYLLEELSTRRMVKSEWEPDPTPSGAEESPPCPTK